MIPALPAAAGPAAAPGPVARPAGTSFGTLLARVSAPGAPRADGRSGPAVRPSAGGDPPGPAVRLLQVVDLARARLDGVLAAARSGRTFTAQELLGLQAEAYRTVQTVDLGVKLVEQGAQAVRQTLATQV